MKYVLSIVLFSMTVFSGMAQNNSLGKNDPEAKKILDEVTNKMKSYKAMQASFTLRLEDAQGNPQGSKSGTAYMKGNKYRLTITGQEVICDGKNIWTYDKSANEVTITKFDPSANSMTPQKMFANSYDKDYLYKLNGQQKMGNKMVQEIELTPVDKTRSVFKIYVYVDKASKTITATKILDKSGTRQIYTITKFNGTANIPDATFVFDKSKYPGVEVVDLGN